MSFEFTGAYGLPSVQTALETVENVFWWGRLVVHRWPYFSR